MLVENESLVEVRVCELSADLLNDLDVLEVGGSLETEDGVDGEVGKVVLVLGENLGGESRASNVEQILAELGCVLGVVDRAGLESLERGLGSNAVTLDDSLRVDLGGRDELLGLTEELGGKNTDRRGSVTDFVVLDLGDVDKDLGGGVVEGDRLEDGRSVVGNDDAAI